MKKLLTLGTSWTADVKAGFMVSLIALPLCMGIAQASGFPPGAGVITAIVGALVAGGLTMKFGGSQLGIKGPAAGLIVVIAPAVHDLGISGALAVFLCVGLLQLFFSRLTVAKHLNRYIPIGVLYGMMAGIGLLLIKSQAPRAFGFETWSNIAHFDDSTAIFFVGYLTLMICAGFALVEKWGATPKIPGVLVAVLVGSGIGLAILPDTVFSIDPHWSWQFTPDFSVVATKPWLFAKHLCIIFLVDTIETAISTRAVDKISSQKTDAEKDLRAIAVGNMVSSFFGGLTMITETARSTANVKFGARGPLSNIVHGLCLLVFMLILSPILHLIPITVLAAVLCFIGATLFLGHLKQIHYNSIEAIAVFTVTAGMTLWHGILEGIVAGFIIELIIAFMYERKLNIFAKPIMEHKGDKTTIILSHGTFIQAAMLEVPKQQSVTIFVKAPYVDTTLREQLDKLITSDGGVTVDYWEKYRNTKHFVPHDERVHPPLVLEK